VNRAACSVSPVIYLYRVGILEWLPKLFDQIWMPTVVLEDLLDARFIGYDVPNPFNIPWFEFQDPELTVPSAWMALDLSSGEVAAMSLAFENRDCIVLMDDPLARRAARDVGLQCWGTIRILLEAKAHGLTEEITTYVDRLASSSLLLSKENRRRILALAGEDHPAPSEEEEEEAEGAVGIEKTPTTETTAAEVMPSVPAEAPVIQVTDVVKDVQKDDGAKITQPPKEIENPEN
jgi:predicted nucleic acid-binding protein